MFKGLLELLLSLLEVGLQQLKCVFGILSLLQDITLLVSNLIDLFLNRLNFVSSAIFTDHSAHCLL